MRNAGRRWGAVVSLTCGAIRSRWVFGVCSRYARPPLLSLTTSSVTANGARCRVGYPTGCVHGKTPPFQSCVTTRVGCSAGRQETRPRASAWMGAARWTSGAIAYVMVNMLCGSVRAQITYSLPLNDSADLSTRPATRSLSPGDWAYYTLDPSVCRSRCVWPRVPSRSPQGDGPGGRVAWTRMGPSLSFHPSSPFPAHCPLPTTLK